MGLALLSGVNLRRRTQEVVATRRCCSNLLRVDSSRLQRGYRNSVRRPTKVLPGDMSAEFVSGSKVLAARYAD